MQRSKKNMPHNKEKSQSVETDAQINKNIKTVIINILHMFRNTGKNEHVRRGIKNVKDPSQTSRNENTVSEMKKIH